MSELKQKGLEVNPENEREYEKILLQAKTWEVPEVRGSEEIWRELEGRISDPGARIIKLRPWLKWAASVAAVAILALTVVMTNPEATYYAESDREEFALPDGSRVMLNRGSTVTFSENLFGKREVELDGMAYFDVIRGDQFRIITPNGRISVLGTTFNVNSFENYLKVECLTGKVVVESKNNEVTLTAGLSVVIENGEMNESAPFETDLGKSWLDGEFIYRNTPVTEVFHEIERQYGVKITADDINLSARYSGLFSNKDDLESTLQSICLPMGLQYHVAGDGSVTIKK